MLKVLLTNNAGEPIAWQCGCGEFALSPYDCNSCSAIRFFKDITKCTANYLSY
jgi:hypothetical protein